MSTEAVIVGSASCCRNGHIAVRNKHGQCLECVRACTRKYQSKNREKAVVYAKEWQTRNPEKAKLHRQNFYRNHKDEILLKAKAWCQNNPEIVNKISRVNAAKRRALLRLRIPRWSDLRLIRNFYDNCPSGYEVDHVVPINGKSVCGLHVPENLQYLTLKENRRKGNLFIEELT